MPTDLPLEYEQLNSTWRATYRACYGLYGMEHPDARYAEIVAWNELVSYCSAHGYLYPDLPQARIQILQEERLTAGLGEENDTDGLVIREGSTRSWLSRFYPRMRSKLTPKKPANA
jgi:hypothetical protein